MGRPGSTFLLTLTSGHRGDTPGAVTPVTPVLPAPSSCGSLHDQYAASLPVVAGADPHLAGDLVAHAPMMAAHLAAAVLVGLWLASGERALWTLIALASSGPTRLVALFAAAVATPVPVRVLPLPEIRPLSQTVVLARSVVRRGPPALLAA